MFPFISIIIAVKNEENYINRCIDSLLELDYPEYEIIVVDNKSDDNTLNLLKTYGDKIKLLENEKPGPSSSRNLGLHYSKGAYIAFTDGDCTVDINWLKELVKGFGVTSNVGAVGGIQESPPDDTLFGKLIQKFLLSTHLISDYVKKSSKKQAIVGTNHNSSCNVMYKKKVFEVVGVFNEDLWPGEDVEFDHKLKKYAYNIMYNPKAKVLHYRPQNFKDFFTMMYRYGQAQSKLIKKHGAFRKIHLMPLLFFALIYALIIIPSYTVLFLYLGLFFALVSYLLKTKNIIHACTLIFMGISAFLIWHIGFLIGFKKI